MNAVNDVNDVHDIFIHPTSFVDEGATIGSGTKIWHFSLVQSGAVIGEHCSLGQNVNAAQNVKIGKGCRIQNNVSIYEGVELEDYVFCGPSCVFTNVNTPRAKYPVHGRYKHTVIEEGASLGANCTIVCGHRVGKWALVAAGAVVASDVKPYSLMMGVPARQKGGVCECGHILSNSEQEQPEYGSHHDLLECESCGRKYKIMYKMVKLDKIVELGCNGYLEEISTPLPSNSKKFINTALFTLFLFQNHLKRTEWLKGVCVIGRRVA